MSLDLKIYSPQDFPKYLPKLSDLYDQLFEGGKGFRAGLVRQVSEFAEVDERTSHLLAQTVEFIHNSSLLHDDLIDRSPLRRGKKAAWLEFGPEYTVLAGDYLLARVIVNLSEHGHIDLVKITGQAISDLLEGEWLQDSVRHKVDVSWEDMDQIHRLKTSSLFSWCLKAPYVFKNADPQAIRCLSQIGDEMGALLQRSDDLLDFNIRNFEGKTSFTDLKAGYLNLFSIHLFKEPDLRKKAYTIKNEPQVLELVGQEALDQALESFDQINEHLIASILAKAKKLQTDFDFSSDFVDFIKEITPKLYWRQ